VRDERLYLIHIRECIARIESYLPGSRDAFMASTMVQDAILRNLQTLAESTQRLSDALKGKHPEIDWRSISGFRNVLVHDYLGVDVARIWEIVDRSLPDLKIKVEAMLQDG